MEITQTSSEHLTHSYMQLQQPAALSAPKIREIYHTKNTHHASIINEPSQKIHPTCNHFSNTLKLQAQRPSQNQDAAMRPDHRQDDTAYFYIRSTPANRKVSRIPLDTALTPCDGRKTSRATILTIEIKTLAKDIINNKKPVFDSASREQSWEQRNSFGKDVVASRNPR